MKIGDVKVRVDVEQVAEGRVVVPVASVAEKLNDVEVIRPVLVIPIARPVENAKNDVQANGNDHAVVVVVELGNVDVVHLVEDLVL